MLLVPSLARKVPLDPVLTAKEWNNSKSDVARWDENSKETYS